MVLARKSYFLEQWILILILAGVQNGFAPRMSCFTNLLLSEQSITQLMNAHESVDVVILDFLKAFTLHK